ncbi:unnamed protein product [Laminaria digitata]
MFNDVIGGEEEGESVFFLIFFWSFEFAFFPSRLVFLLLYYFNFSSSSFLLPVRSVSVGKHVIGACQRGLSSRKRLFQKRVFKLCFEKTKTKKEMNKQEGDAGLGLGGDFLFMFRRGVRVPNCGLLSKGHKRAVGTRDIVSKHRLSPLYGF